MSGTPLQLGHGFNPSGKPPSPEEHQDESTEHVKLLTTWDACSDGATGTDRQGKKKKKWGNPFKSKPSNYKSETDKISPDQRQELH